MKNSKLVNKITNAYVMLIYVFVFIPVIVMVAFSFNSLPSISIGKASRLIITANCFLIVK